MKEIKNLKDKFLRNSEPKPEQEKCVGENEFIELSANEEKKPLKILIKSFELNDFADTKDISEALRETNTICVIKIKELKEKDPMELKRAVLKLKKIINVDGGDVIGIDKNYVIAAPRYVSVVKGAKSENNGLYEREFEG